MRLHVAALAAIFLGWFGTCVLSQIDDDMVSTLDLWNLQPVEMKWSSDSDLMRAIHYPADDIKVLFLPYNKMFYKNAILHHEINVYVDIYFELIS